MIRVVLDTNVVVAALLTPQGLPAHILMLCLTDSEMNLCMSDKIYAELEEVIRRPKFKREAREVDSILRGIHQNCVWFQPMALVNVCSDPDDNMFLECAEAAGANFLVTGNTRHFPAVWGSTQVLTPRQFLDLLG